MLSRLYICAYEITGCIFIFRVQLKLNEEK